MSARFSAWALALCAVLLGPAPAFAGKPAHDAAQVRRGLAFAAAHCTGCHAITANGSSPNPASPPFDDIANMPGLTAQTFAQFLTDSHNFPAAMDFTVDHRAARDLAAYMLTLRKPGYRPQR